MKLTIEHLAPYLPYGLRVRYIDENNTAILIGITYIGNIIHGQLDFNGVLGLYEFNDFEPILHPLSDLTKEIEHNGEKFVPIEVLDGYSSGWFGGDLVRKGRDIYETPYASAQKLFEWHFDVFGLIEEGLAIDINTLKA